MSVRGWCLVAATGAAAAAQKVHQMAAVARLSSAPRDVDVCRVHTNDLTRLDWTPVGPFP